MGLKIGVFERFEGSGGLCDSLPWEGVGRGLAALLNPFPPLHKLPHPSPRKEFLRVTNLPNTPIFKPIATLGVS